MRHISAFNKKAPPVLVTPNGAVNPRGTVDAPKGQFDLRPTVTRFQAMEATVDSREQRALEIADRFRIVESNGQFFVPSQKIANKKYAVRIGRASEFCNCPDFELRHTPCKHVLAVRLTIQRELNFDGTTTVTETVEVTKRTTYPQDWPAYNTAQTTEKDHFQMLLHDLCSGIQGPIQTNGRPRMSLAESAFCAAFKVYSGFSARRFMSDLREANERGYVEKVPHFNSVLNALENPS